jgi:hypothetical protein
MKIMIVIIPTNAIAIVMPNMDFLLSIDAGFKFDSPHKKAL